MAINIIRYVDITSGVGAAVVVPRRNLIGRIFTTNPLLPTQSFIEFNDAADVGTYFGFTSVEYLRALFYFSWVSKNNTSPQKLSFARWVSSPEAAMIFGAKAAPLATYTAITSGSLGLTIGGVAETFTAIDLSAATDLADVAAELQTAIRTGTGTQFTAATVTFDATRGGFDFVSGSAVAATITVQEGVGGTPIAGLIGWLAGAILSNGSLTETITQTLTNSAAASNNFGSFIFMPTLTLSQAIEAATWNESQNVLYLYLVPVTTADVETANPTWQDPALGLGGIGGCGAVLSNINTQYPEQVPMMILAATDYDEPNTTQNYMFQQFILSPSVSSDADANIMDTAKVNYYGQTQTAGQLIAFFQRGVLFGQGNDPLDMNVYANEMWLKDAAAANILTLLLAIAKVSANKQGRGQILTILQPVIDAALNNGTISVNKTLSQTQILFITQVTGDPQAYYQVQTIGYWIDCAIVPVTSPTVGFKAVYTLVYSKDDVIRMVTGTHDLI